MITKTFKISLLTALIALNCSSAHAGAWDQTASVITTLLQRGPSWAITLYSAYRIKEASRAYNAQGDSAPLCLSMTTTTIFGYLVYRNEKSFQGLAGVTTGAYLLERGATGLYSGSHSGEWSNSRGPIAHFVFNVGKLGLGGLFMYHHFKN